jgi:hypothetical protein
VPKRVGVLLVHGIGEQQAGSTLAEWGEALCAWLDAWGRGAGVWHRHNGLNSEQIDSFLQAVDRKATNDPSARQAAYSFANPLRETRSRPEGGSPAPKQKAVLGGTCALSDVVLTPAATDPHTPAHGVLTLTQLRLDGDVTHHSVQLAEAHWADSFPPPAYTEFLRWATLHLPLILQAHLGWGLYQARAGESRKLGARLNRWVDVAGWYSLSLLLPVFPVFALCLLAASLPLSIAPLGVARDLARRIRALVVNVLGDSYVLLERPARAAAIRERVRSSLAWLAARCDTVIVVAHSQGAAVALDYLVEEPQPMVARLVTLGSGARKLGHLRFQRQGSSAYGTCGSAWLAVVAPVLLVLATHDLLAGQRPSWLSLSLVVCVTAVFLGSRWRHGSRDHLQDSKEWRRLLASVEIPWTDLAASVDPVANGAHVVPKGGNTRPPDLKSLEIQNRGSLLSDHTTYWENTAQFLPRVAEIIAAELGITTKALTPFDGLTLSHAWFAHAFRVSYLRLGRSVLWMALLHVILSGQGALRIAGSRVLSALSSAPLDLPNWVARLLGGLLDFNFGQGREWLVGLLTFLALTTAGQSLWTSVWSVADGKAAARMFRRNADPTHGHRRTPPDLVLFGYGWLLIYFAWLLFFRYVPPPPLLSIETLIAALLVLLHLGDIATCLRFIGQALRHAR